MFRRIHLKYASLAASLALCANFNQVNANETSPSGATNKFRNCEMVKFREWICDGQKIEKGSLTESVLTATEFPCLDRIPTPDDPCDQIGVSREYPGGMNIEYCLKPNCLDLIAPESDEMSE